MHDVIDLPIERVNALSPYKVYINNNGSLGFETQYGSVYEVGFVEDYTFMDENAFQFFILESQGKHSVKDPLVRETIWVILETFFLENNPGLYLLVLICGAKCLFSQKFYMKKSILVPLLFMISCAQNTQTHPPVGGFLSENDLNTSKNRAKNLNETERIQIQDWIANQQEKFFPMSLNYWINVENLQQNPKKNDGESISYQYELYDFDYVKLYDAPKKNISVQFGRFEELKAVEDVLRYMQKGQEATILVPSVLAFGTYGDNDKIPNDMPLIIKIKIL